MNHHRDEEEFYASLKEKLTNSTLWPSEYLYKFIIPNVEERIQQLQKVFDNKGAAITTKKIFLWELYKFFGESSSEES